MPLCLPTVHMFPVSQNLIVKLFSHLSFQNGRLVLTAPVPDNSLSVMKLIKFSIYNLYYKSLNGYVRKRSEMYTLLNPIFIRKTCPCNEYPLEPHFYIAKLGYAGVYLFFLVLLQNIDCGYSLEPPRRGGSNVYPQSMF